MGGSVGTALSVGSSLYGAMGGNDISGSDPSGAMNNILSNALGQALPYSEQYTQQAIGAQNSSLQAALGELNQAMTSTTNTLNNAFQTSQALQSPYRNMGYQAADMYADSLHMSRPKMGSQALSTALTNQVQTQQQLQSLLQGKQALNGLYDVGGIDPATMPNAPTRDALIANGDIRPQDIDAYIKGNSTVEPFAIYNYQGVRPDSAPSGGVSAYGQDTRYGPAGLKAGDPSGVGVGQGGLQTIMSNPNIRSAVQNELANPLLKQAQNAYDLQQYNYNQLGQFLQNNFTPNQQNISLAYNRGLFNNLGSQNLY